MKMIVSSVIILLALSMQSHAQKGKNAVSIGPEVDLPMGSFGDYYKLGIGGSVKGLYGIGSAGQVTLTVGYVAFKGKSDANGFDLSDQKFNIMPILAGYRQNFSGFYVEPQLGIGSYTTKANGFKFTETRFTWAVGAGYSLQNVDLGLRFQSHEGASLLGFRAAYVIPFGK